MRRWLAALVVVVSVVVLPVSVAGAVTVTPGNACTVSIGGTAPTTNSSGVISYTGLRLEAACVFTATGTDELEMFVTDGTYDIEFLVNQDPKVSSGFSSLSVSVPWCTSGQVVTVSGGSAECVFDVMTPAQWASNAYPAIPSSAFNNWNGTVVYGTATMGTVYGVAAPCNVSVDSGVKVMNQQKAYTFTGTVSPGSAGLFAVPSVDPSFAVNTPSTVPTNWLSEDVNGTATMGFFHMLDTLGNTWGMTLDYTTSGSILASAPAVELWCVYFPGGLNQTNSGGTWVDEGPLITLYNAAVSNVYGPSPSTGAGCLGSVSIGINPSSWLMAAYQGAGCLLSGLFVPSSASVSAIENQFGVTSNDPAVGSSSATQWLGNIGYMLTVGPAAGAEAIQADEQAGATSSLIDVGPSVTVGSTVYSANLPSIVSAIASTGGGSWLPMILLVLTALLLVDLFILIATWLRRVLGSKE